MGHRPLLLALWEHLSCVSPPQSSKARVPNGKSQKGVGRPSATELDARGPLASTPPGRGGHGHGAPKGGHFQHTGCRLWGAGGYVWRPILSASVFLRGAFYTTVNFILVRIALPQILLASFPNSHCFPTSDMPEQLSIPFLIESGLPTTPASALGLGGWTTPCQPPPCCVLCWFTPALFLHGLVDPRAS